MRQYTARYEIWDNYENRSIIGDPIEYYQSDEEAKEQMIQKVNASYPPPQYEIESFKVHYVGTGDPTLPIEPYEI